MSSLGARRDGDYVADLAHPIAAAELPDVLGWDTNQSSWASSAFAKSAQPRACHRVESAASDHVPVVLDVDP